ncbi:hypothetical protein [Vibrio campbellii]|uniref:hypothetical protein n=1 Tax=Vibrio campbellii TaxID=680 RepID=UPI00210CE73A|nr:hypothetical protein [Vibrio campbellii]UTZ44515.1 hypothetical protein HB764_24970 [Vibrio campbellii]
MIKRGDLVRIKSLEDIVFVFESMCVSAVGQQNNVFNLLAILHPKQPLVLSGITLNLSDELIVNAQDIELVDSVF